MFRSIRTQLFSIILGFSILLLGSLVGTFFSVMGHATDEDRVLIAGHQRSIVQQMAWLAIAQPENPRLERWIDHFEINLVAMREGGVAFDAENRAYALRPIQDRETLARLDVVAETWRSYRENVRFVASLDTDLQQRQQLEAVLQTESLLIIDQLDVFLRALDAHIEAEHRQILILEIIFMVVALPLIVWWLRVINSRITSPLYSLVDSANRIGEGNLQEPVKIAGDDEIGTLARAFDAMRIALQEDRQMLETRIDERTREIATAFELSQEIVSQLDYAQLLNSVVHRTKSLLRGKGASLCLVTDEGRCVQMAATTLDLVPGPTFIQPKDNLFQILEEGQTLTLKALNSTCQFVKSHPDDHLVETSLRVGEAIIGSLCAVRDRDSPPFGESEMTALSLLANSVAIAIANVHLVEEKREQAELAAQLSERESLASELHDHLVQTLGTLNLQASHLKELVSKENDPELLSAVREVEGSVKTAFGQIRTALSGLATAPSEDLDFASGLGEIVEQFQAESSLKTDLDICPHSAKIIAAPMARQALQIAQEALINVRRHAQAGAVQVGVCQENGSVVMKIQDNGRGFVPEDVKSAHHLGLRIMRSRAERSGGMLLISSVVGGGTTIEARFPTKEQESS